MKALTYTVKTLLVNMIKQKLLDILKVPYYT
jgi:hypothetical protein